MTPTSPAEWAAFHATAPGSPEYIALRNAIVEANLGMARDQAKRLYRWMGGDYDDVYQTCCAAMIRCVELFNPSLGWQFSTYYFNSAIRLVARSRRKADPAQQWTAFAETAAAGVMDEHGQPFDGELESMNRAKIRAAIAGLDERAAKVVIMRRFWGQTLTQVAGVLRITKERVRQIQRHAEEVIAARVKAKGETP